MINSVCNVVCHTIDTAGVMPSLYLAEKRHLARYLAEILRLARIFGPKMTFGKNSETVCYSSSFN